MKHTLIAAAVAALLAGVLAPTTSAGAPAGTLATAAPDDPIVVHVNDLPVRPNAAEVAWLVDNKLHTRSGKIKTLPWTLDKAYSTTLGLLGRVSNGWLVENYSDHGMVWRVTRGERTKLADFWDSEGSHHGVRVANDGGSFAIVYTNLDPNDGLILTLMNLNGREIGFHDFEDGSLADYSGAEAVVTQGRANGQRLVLSDDSVTDLGVPIVAADLGLDLAFVPNQATGLVGPTSLSAPGVPAWTAPMETIAISTDGSRVLSRPGDRQPLEVRDVATGELLVSYQLYPTYEGVVWDTDHTFLVITKFGPRERQALLRCDIAGKCVRVSEKTWADQLSLPKK